MTTKRIGLDTKGNVVEKLEDAVVVMESELDAKGKLVRETTYRAEGKELPPMTVITK
jgi:hypothetical protein